jgi:hypothetical protein
MSEGENKVIDPSNSAPFEAGRAVAGRRSTPLATSEWECEPEHLSETFDRSPKIGGGKGRTSSFEFGL